MCLQWFVGLPKSALLKDFPSYIVNRRNHCGVWSVFRFNIELKRKMLWMLFQNAKLQIEVLYMRSYSQKLAFLVIKTTLTPFLLLFMFVLDSCLFMFLSLSCLLCWPPLLCWAAVNVSCCDQMSYDLWLVASRFLCFWNIFNVHSNRMYRIFWPIGRSWPKMYNWVEKNISYTGTPNL